MPAIPQIWVDRHNRQGRRCDFSTWTTKVGTESFVAKESSSSMGTGEGHSSGPNRHRFLAPPF
eukprot:scaffold257898_cov31-Tisochrysis_lutea.AAC.4